MLLLIITLLGCGGCTVKEQGADETGKVESPKEDTSKDDTAGDTAEK